MDASHTRRHLSWRYQRTKKYRPAPKSTVPRIARSYQPVVIASLDRTSYPAQAEFLTPSLDNLSLCQGLLANEANFACESSCDVLEIYETGRRSWKYGWNDEKIMTYIKPFLDGQVKSTPQGLNLRVLFCNLRRHPDTSFGYQLSLSKPTTKSLLTAFRVFPHFLPFMLGEPDYWAPLFIPLRNDKRVVRIEATWQHPRYNIHARQQPCSVYMGYDFAEACTTYIIVSGEGEEYVERTKTRLNDYFADDDGLAAAAGQISDPFLLQSILCHESLTDGKEIITKLRHRLYDQLDVVGEYAKEPFDKSNLQEMTNQLHLISQDADSLFASTEMAGMISTHMGKARQRTSKLSPNIFHKSNVGDALAYLIDSIEAQKRWLQSLKSRKDIAMNLVFNLVTQQDSETSTSIARDTKEDSASMKIIAVMTMLFLPTTAVSGFFSMSFFSMSGPLQTSGDIGLFFAVALPLTFLIFLTWWMWYSVESTVRNVCYFVSLRYRGFRFRLKTEKDEERGN
ncbi:hypothetical protein DIZ76_010726 [Coccidioides immitis]|nr:hypothetical protein DIZ76_010726 [Coccidioides immitis]